MQGRDHEYACVKTASRSGACRKNHDRDQEMAGVLQEMQKLSRHL